MSENSNENDQSWYWSEAWQKMELEADADLANGDYIDFDSADALLTNLHAEMQIPKKKCNNSHP